MSASSELKQLALRSQLLSMVRNEIDSIGALAFTPGSPGSPCEKSERISRMFKRFRGIRSQERDACLAGKRLAVYTLSKIKSPGDIVMPRLARPWFVLVKDGERELMETARGLIGKLITWKYVEETGKFESGREFEGSIEKKAVRTVSLTFETFQLKRRTFRLAEKLLV